MLYLNHIPNQFDIQLHDIEYWDCLHSLVHSYMLLDDL